jgi:hypothetical protein
MKRLTATTCLAASIGLAIGSNAVGAPEAEPVGQIMRIDGAAMISQGTRYVDAREGMPLRVQDRVLVLDGGSALLQFTDGCQYQLEDSELLTIGTESACAEKAAKTAAGQNQSGVPIETAAAESQDMATGIEQGATSAMGDPPKIDYGVLGLLGAAGAGVIWALTDDDPDRPTSQTLLSQQ